MLRLSPYTFSALIIAIAILLTPGFTNCLFSGERPAKDTYQAVFIGKGDLVYYGHLSNTASQYLSLSDVYYLKQNQATVDPKTGETVQPKTPLDLVKYGNQETYRPEDTLHIPAGQILYWTNLLPDSPVVAAIQRAKAASAEAAAPTKK